MSGRGNRIGVGKGGGVGSFSRIDRAQIGIVDSALHVYTFCKREREDILHFLWDCTELTSF